jgi:hypothetical protein
MMPTNSPFQDRVWWGTRLAYYKLRNSGHAAFVQSLAVPNAAQEELMGLSEHKDHREQDQLSANQANTISTQEQEDERRKLRRLQIMMNMVMSVLSQDEEMTVEEAAELAANAKRAALAMFPDKELAYDILYRPRLQRIIAERFRVQ